MKKHFTAFCTAMIAAAALLAAPTHAEAKGGPFGLGIMLGDPTGLSANYKMSKQNELDFGAAWSFRYAWLYLPVAYHWMFANLGSGAHQFLPYVGVGPAIAVGGKDIYVGGRVPVGISWRPQAAPIDVFLEVVPGLALVPDAGFHLDAAIGVRYYF